MPPAGAAPLPRRWRPLVVASLLLVVGLALLPGGPPHAPLAPQLLAVASVARLLADPAALPPLTVATHALWLDASAVLGELWLLSVVAEVAVGRRLVPFGGGDAAPDVLLLGPYGNRREEGGAVARSSRARTISVFIGCENTYKDRFDSFQDQMVGDVLLSLGHRRDVSAASYLRMPWWLPFVVERSNRTGLAFPERLRAPTTPAQVDEWTQRPGFAALLSSHYAFPRGELFDAFAQISGGRVAGPGEAFHNTEWPAAIKRNHHLNGKVEFLQGYRYNLCPENSRSRDGGYTTEKMPQAHLAGAVPVFWGDPPDIDTVFNAERILFWDDVSGLVGADDPVLAVVAQLESNASFREAFFRRPVLLPGAEAWLASWLDAAALRFRATFEATLPARDEVEASRALIAATEKAERAEAAAAAASAAETAK